MKRGNRWEDHYARLARTEKWLARSVYKLEEFDKKFQLVCRGARILDLGCYPGSWSQYCLKKIGPEGEVIGIDLRKPDRLSAQNFRFIKTDAMVLDREWLNREIGRVDVVISDMAPKTTGVPLTDVSRSMELARSAFDVASTVLDGKGHFLCKVFEGEDLKAYREELSSHFEQVRTLRPAAVRKGSRETYIVGLKFTE